MLSGDCQPTQSQKSPVHLLTHLFHHNLSRTTATYITFVSMQRHKTKYVIEVIIHALFWLGVYYALHSLTAASFNMIVYDNGNPTGGVNAHMLFPYPEVVLGVLALLFYGNIFWLNLSRPGATVVVIAAWLVLLFTINYFAVRMLTAPSGSAHHRPIAASPPPTIRMSFSADTLSSVPSDNAHRLNASLPSHPPFQPPKMEFSAEDWWNMQLVMAIIFLAILGIAVAYFFIKEWIRNDLTRSQAEALQLDTEIRFLRSQVNPHFLFNTLNNLFSMAQKRDNIELADGILKLSGMMRYMLYESNTNNVPLQKEIEYLEDCIALNKLRYAGSEIAINFHHPAPNGVAAIQVTPMLFIPFLENAFKHGVLIGRNSHITMTISVNQKKLIFTCENTDHSTVQLEEENGGIGLENVKRRLELVYPGRHQLQAGPEGGKYKVNLQIDLS